MKTIKTILLCIILGNHDWTSLAMRDEIPPLPENPTPSDLKLGFIKAARMSCARCGKISQQSIDFEKRINYIP